MIMKNQLLNLKMIALVCLMMVLGGANVWAEEEVISLANGSFANDQITWTGTSCSIIQSQNGAQTSPNGSYISAPRWYSGNKVSFKANEGYKIESALITCTSTNYATALGTSKYTNATAKVNNTIVTITASGDFEVTLGGQSRISKITIIYSKDTPTTPILSVSESTLDFGANECNTNIAKKFTLSGVCLTASANITLAGSNSEMFSVSPTSIPQTDGTIAETDVTVSYNPTSVGSHTATLTISSAGAEDKTITLNGKSANAYNVSWNVNGNVYTDGTPTNKVFEDEKVSVLPTAPADINGKVFVGWTNASLSVAQDAAPSVLFTDAADAPTVTGDVTYYAVFAKRAGDGEVTYTKLTSNQFKTDATYVIGAQQLTTNNTMWYFNGNVDNSWGKMTSTTSIKSLMTFTLSGSASALVVKGDNGKYLSKPIDKKFNEMTSEEIQILLTSDGTVKNSDNTLSLKYNYNSGNGGLRWYSSSSTGTQAYFYEVSGGYTYSGYCTTVAEPTYTPATVNFVAHAGDDYYATFSNAKVVFMPKYVTISAVTVDNNNVVMRKSTEGVLGTEETVNIEGTDVAGYYIPANTGVLLNSQKGGEVTYYTVENKEVAAYNADLDNMLMPSVAGGKFTAETGKVYYKLAYNDYKAQTGLGFYWGAEAGGAFYVKAGTAYLAVPEAKAAGAKGFTLNGEATGIESVNANVENAKAIYNLNGQRVASMAKPGLYIVNGKKVVRK